ncbi:MAG: type II toxin-antitoxin system RelE/ParE family toxin [Acidobacteriaceae bacterium]|nr:type II toxin-antitoxin system RelE/ParE family toxin [Acidobacteriaceae bacterium]
MESFKDKETRTIFETGRSRKFGSVAKSAKQKLDQIDLARTLADLRTPPGNRLEALKGDRSGQYSIRVNDQYRICFVWHEEGAYKVEVCDYH